MLLINEQWIKKELGTLYGNSVVKDIQRINELYAIYDGPGQDWQIASGLKYRPNKTITNYIRTIIKAESRFMMSRAPEIKFVPKDSKQAKAGDQYDAFLTDVLNASRWQRKLIQAGRDCFIGKRVALKLTGGPGKPLRVDFRPSQEFVFDVEDDDVNMLKKIVFFYQIMGEKAEETDKTKQRIWCQRYEMQSGRCILDQGIFDGYGEPIGETITAQDTGLDFIPCFVIINDGLTGDMTGESDVEMLISNQDTYNHTNSDDADALRFNMFPMRYTVDASEESAQQIEIAPAAYADIASDAAGTGENKQAKIGILESTFSYNERAENRLNRTKSDMYAMLSVPNVSLEQLKGLAQSGKGMRSLYWELICRCNEKWAEGWDDALRWMAENLVKMAVSYGVARLPELDCTIQIEHLYPIPEDEEDERMNDMSEVNAKVRSRVSYIDKWQPNA
ncbi:MAG: phage portal protein, partial [Clostridia bacterium]